jgi:hypothetical protein
MKKLFVILASVFVFFGSNAFASIVVYDAGDTTSINAWKVNLGGNEKVIETFNNKAPGGWHTSFSTGAGTFTAGGLVGEGKSSYNYLNDPDSNDPHFRISNQNIYGRTGGDGDYFLDSADITKLTLDVSPQLTNLWFYIQRIMGTRYKIIDLLCPFGKRV